MTQEEKLDQSGKLNRPEIINVGDVGARFDVFARVKNLAELGTGGSVLFVLFTQAMASKINSENSICSTYAKFNVGKKVKVEKALGKMSKPES